MATSTSYAQDTSPTSTALSTYTFDNHSDWTGDGNGLDVEDIEETEYLSGL